MEKRKEKIIRAEDNENGRGEKASIFSLVHSSKNML